MLKTYKRKVLSAALTAAILLGLIFGSVLTNRPAKAKSCYSTERDYYDDAEYTNLVGQYYWPCDGQPSHWGTITPYLETSVEPCGGIGCESR